MYVHSVLRVLINIHIHVHGGGINVHTESRRTCILEIVGWKMRIVWKYGDRVRWNHNLFLYQGKSPLSSSDVSLVCYLHDRCIDYKYLVLTVQCTVSSRGVKVHA